MKLFSVISVLCVFTILGSFVYKQVYAASSVSHQGSYHLLLSESPDGGEGGKEICTDGRDNDGDGLIDCLDDDCFSNSICINPCTNNILDFGEYWTDCGGRCGKCPTCVDGIQNGDETGVDCGGTCLSCDATGDAQIVDVKNITEYNYNFRMYLPPGYSPEGSFPLLLFLHGAGERGDNLDLMDNNGPLKYVNESWWNYDFVIIAPQVPTGSNWSATKVKGLFDRVKAVYTGIDQSRVYITGLSMGGFGVNQIMRGTDNSWVTANAEICGVVATNEQACNYKNTPSWSFSCDVDPVVGFAWSIAPWAKILHGEDQNYSCGNSEPNPLIKISLFDCNSHNSWARVYDPFKNEGSYILSTDRDVNSQHQFNYGVVNGAPPLYDWFLNSR